MLEVLKFYASDFWVWLGITIGIGAVAGAFRGFVSDVFLGFTGSKQ